MHESCIEFCVKFLSRFWEELQKLIASSLAKAKAGEVLAHILVAFIDSLMAVPCLR